MTRIPRPDPIHALRMLHGAFPDVSPGRRRVRVVGVVTLLCLLALAVPVVAGMDGETGGSGEVRIDDERATVADVDGAPTGSFGRGLYTTTAGDLVEIDVSVDDGPAYVVIGGDQLSDGTPTGFLDVLRVDGSRTITVNTRLLGTNAPTDEVYATDDGSVHSYAHGDGWDAGTEINDTAFSGLAFEAETDDGPEELTSLEELREAAGVGYNPAPLAPQRYRLLVGYGETITVRDGTVHLEHRLDRADLRLVQPDFRDRIDVYTGLDDDVADAESVDDVLGPARERTRVTKGDRVILGLEATGIWGTIAAQSGDHSLGSSGSLDAETLHDLATSDEGEIRGEGVTLTVRQTNVGMNERRTELDLADADPDDLVLLYGSPETLDGHGNDPSPSALYLVIDTGPDSAFTDDVEPGEEYAVEFALEGTEGDRYRFHRPDGGAGDPFAPESAADDGVDEQFPYLGVGEGGVSTTATFSIREPTLAFDDRVDDIVLVENGTTATLAGNTTLHPETDLTAEFVADTDSGTSVDRRTVDITDNDTFSIDTELASLDPGSPVSLELYDGSELYDTRSLVIVEDVERPSDLVVDDAPEDVTVTRGETLENLTVTVRNDGHVEGTERVSIDVGDGALEDDRRVRVRPDARSAVAFSRTVVEIDPGEYRYTIGIDGEEAVGLLTVEPGPDWESPEDTGDETDDTTGDDETDDTTGDDETDETTGDHETDETAGNDRAPRRSIGGDGEETDDGEGADTTEENDGEEVTDVEEGGAQETADSRRTDEDDGDPEERASIPLPLGIGTREAFAGTIIVGAMYVVGHWV